MEIDRQLEILINDGAKYGVAPTVIEKAIAPALKLFANQLKYLEYYVVQNLQGDWILTTISNPKLRQEKKVIYAFASVQDAARFQGKVDPDILAVAIPVTHLLFRLISLQEVDSVIFADNSSNITSSNITSEIEIQRDRLSNLIKQQIRQLNQTPPNIA
jgi:hypothetical protein